MMRICSIQFNPEVGDKEDRTDKVIDLVTDSADFKPDLVVLPELWNVGFFNFDDYKSKSEKIEDSRTIREMGKLAKEINSFVHAGSIIERKASDYFNTSVLLDRDGEIVDTYRKVHLFGYESEESKILSPGSDLCVAETELGSLGLTTCYDLRFPELYRKLVDDGAKLFLVTSAWPYPRVEHWLMLNRVRAFENQAFLVSSNCVGDTEGGNYLGHSRVVNPWGTVVAGAGFHEDILKTEIDISEVENSREDFPALKDKKIFYKGSG